MSWSFVIDSELVIELERDMNRGAIIELAEEREDGLELIRIEKRAVGRLGGQKMHIYANEHPPPHFHVKYQGQENSFSIDNASPLHTDGGLKKWFKNIQKWHKQHREELIIAWNKYRPSDCPVGPMVC